MLRALHLTDWCCYQGDHTIHLSTPVALFVGANGAGKTAIGDALSFLIRGLCRGIDKKKDLAAVVIHDQAKRTTVVGQLGTLTIERSLTRSGSETLRLTEWEGSEKRELPGTPAQLQAELYRRLALDDGKARAALESWAFLGLDDEARKALLFRAIGAGKADVPAVVGKLGLRGFSGADVEWLAKIAIEHGFRKAEAAAIEQRRVVKRELEELPAPQTGGVRFITLDSEEIDLDQVVVADLEARVRERQGELEEALRAGGEEIGRLRGLLEVARARESELAAIAAQAAPADGPLRLSLTMASERAEKGAGAIQLLDQRLAELRAAVSIAEQGLEHPGVCPKIAGEFLCPATNQGLEVHARRLRKQAAAAGEEIAKLEAERAEIESRRQAAADEAEKLNAELAGAQETARRIEQAQHDLGAIRKTITRHVAEIEHAEGNPGKVEFLRARIARAEAVLEPARKWHAAKNDTSAEQRVALTEKMRRADDLAKALAPDGVEADLVREALAPIRERLTRTQSMLGEITIADDLTIEVRVGGKPRSEAQLSRSQRLRVAIAMQDAIAATTSFPVLVVDEVDVFAGATKSAVLRALVGLADSYGNVLLLQTLQRGEDPRELAKALPPEIALLHVHDGQVEAIG